MCPLQPINQMRGGFYWLSEIALLMMQSRAYVEQQNFSVDDILFREGVKVHRQSPGCRRKQVTLVQFIALASEAQSRSGMHFGYGSAFLHRSLVHFFFGDESVRLLGHDTMIAFMSVETCHKPYLARRGSFTNSLLTFRESLEQVVSYIFGRKKRIMIVSTMRPHHNDNSLVSHE